MTTKMGQGALLQLVQDHREQAEAGHHRLREDVRALEKQAETLDERITALFRRVQKMEQTPVNVEKVSFNGRQLVAIVGSVISACVILGGGIWHVGGSVSDLHSEMGTLSQTVASSTKLQDERTEAQKQQMNDLKAGLELRRIEIQNLSNKLTEYMAQKH